MTIHDRLKELTRHVRKTKGEGEALNFYVKYIQPIKEYFGGDDAVKEESLMIDKLANESPLKTKLNVANEAAFMNLLVELGYREDKTWTDEENELLTKLSELAQKHTDNILKEYNDMESKGFVIMTNNGNFIGDNNVIVAKLPLARIFIDKIHAESEKKLVELDYSKTDYSFQIKEVMMKLL